MVMLTVSPDFKEVVRRYNSGAGHEQTAAGKGVVSVEKLHQGSEGPLDLPDRRGTRKCFAAPSLDGELDFRFRRQAVAQEHSRPQSRAAVVHLGLGKVEGVFPFDIPGAHVVADREAENATAAVDCQGELRFWNIPFGIFAYPHRCSMSYSGAAAAFVEKLRALGIVHPVVEGTSPRFLGFLHTRIPAAVIGNAGSPDLLAVGRGSL